MNKGMQSLGVVLLAVAFVLAIVVIAPQKVHADDNSTNITPTEFDFKTISTNSSFQLKFVPQVSIDSNKNSILNLDNQKLYIYITTPIKDVKSFTLNASLSDANPSIDNISKLDLPVTFVGTTEGRGKPVVSSNEMKMYTHIYVIDYSSQKSNIENMFGSTVLTDPFNTYISASPVDQSTDVYASTNVPMRFKYGTSPGPSTDPVNWYYPYSSSATVNGAAIGAIDLAPIDVSSGNPLSVDFQYSIKLLPSTVKELPTLVILESRDKSDRAVFYSVLTNVSSIGITSTRDSNVSGIVSTFTYHVDIYKSLDPSKKYDLEVKIYPATDSNNLTVSELNYAYKNYVKTYTQELSFNNVPTYSDYFILRDISGIMNGRTVPMMNGNVNSSSIARSPDMMESTDATEIDSSGDVVISSSDNVNVVVPRMMSESRIQQMRRMMSSTDIISSIDENNLVVSQTSTGVAASPAVYIKENNSTRKLKGIDSVLSEQNINPSDVSGDIQLVNINNNPEYIIQIKEQRRLFGFIPIGYRTSTRTIDATENLPNWFSFFFIFFRLKKGLNKQLYIIYIWQER